MNELMPRAARESEPKRVRIFNFALIYKPGSILLIFTYLGEVSKCNMWRGGWNNLTEQEITREIQQAWE